MDREREREKDDFFSLDDKIQREESFIIFLDHLIHEQHE